MLNAFVTAAAEETQSPVLPALPDLVWGSLAFAIVLAFFLWKVLPSMNAMLDARREAIEGGIKRAEEMQSRATAALEEYTAKLAEARTEAAQIRDQARADGAKILAELRENAHALHSFPTRRSSDLIAAERQSALVSLRTDVGSLAIDLAGGVIGESLSDDAKAKAVVDRFIAELETAQTAGKA